MSVKGTEIKFVERSRGTRSWLSSGGKTTLAREFVPMDSTNYFDLESSFVAELMANPMTALKGLD